MERIMFVIFRILKFLCICCFKRALGAKICLCVMVAQGVWCANAVAQKGKDQISIKEQLEMQERARKKQEEARVRREKQIFQEQLKQLESLKRSRKEGPLLDLVSQILNRDPDNALALSTLGAFYLQSGKNQLAKIIFTRALKKHPKNSSLHGNLATIALKEDRREKAIAGFQKSIKYRYSNYASAANLGTLYMQSKEHSLALDYLELAYGRVKGRLSLTHPKVVKVGNNYAVALARAGDFRKSEGVFRELLKKNPGKVELLLNYAILLGKDLKKIEKSRQFARKADLMDKSGRHKRRIKVILKLSQPQSNKKKG